MIFPDVNVLIACSRSDHPHHQVATQWLKQALVNDVLYILPVVASGLLRLVTHPKVFVQPTPTKDAARFLEALLELQSVEMSEIGMHEWRACLAMCVEKNLTGNQVPDALIAASALSNGGRVVTFDRDFLALIPKRSLLLLRG